MQMAALKDGFRLGRGPFSVVLVDSMQSWEPSVCGRHLSMT